MKILVIDPDWRFAQQTRDYLESHAHLVVHQTSASGGVSQADRWQPDLVILAAELADDALVASLNSSATRPALLLTDHMDRFDRAWRAWQKCGDELLMKPILKTDELQAAMVAALENAAAGTIIRHNRAASA